MDNPARFLRERAEIEHLENEVDWLTTVWVLKKSGLVSIDLSMAVHGRTYQGQMTYPNVFPNSPPYIRPRDVSEVWSQHQYGAGGSLCLEWRADNWQPEITGADIIRSAYKLLINEQSPTHPMTVRSAHMLTDGQVMSSKKRRFVATHELIRNWLALKKPSITAIKTATVYSCIMHLTAITFVTDVSDANNAMLKVPDLPTGLTDKTHLFSLSGEGWLFRSDTFNLKQSISSIDELISILTSAGLPTDVVLAQEDGKNIARTVALLGRRPDSLRIFLVEPGKEQNFHEITAILPNPSEVRLPPDAARLATLRIGIIGMGSIGSKVAISLARSGVLNFLLIDDDYLIPGNMVRHELSWAHVGANKVHAVHETLRLIAPGVQVESRTTRVAGQESSITAADTQKDLSNCDLLIDATANPEVFLLLAAIAKQYKKPLCWGEVFAGGYGGMISRARPDYEPNPLAVRDAIYGHLEKLPPAPYKTATGYDVVDADQQSQLAYDADVGFIATALTRLVLDTALQNNSSNFPYSVYLIGMRKEWIFDAPFDTQPIDVQGEGWGNNDGVVTDKDRLDVYKTLIEMSEGGNSANSDSTS